MKNENQLYYLKYTKGFLVYIKDDRGRRIKTTFSDFYNSYDPKKETNLHDLVELIPIDEKYEIKMDKMELERALEKENTFDPYQTNLF